MYSLLARGYTAQRVRLSGRAYSVAGVDTLLARGYTAERVRLSGCAYSVADTAERVRLSGRRAYSVAGVDISPCWDVDTLPSTRFSGCVVIERVYVCGGAGVCAVLRLRA